MARAQVLAHGTSDLPDHVAVEAEPVLVEAARRLDPPRLRRVLGHLHQVADPEGADRQAERRHQRRRLWLTPTFEGMVAIDGLLEAEAGQTLLSVLEPLARPADAADTRSGGQLRAAMALLSDPWWRPLPAVGPRPDQPGRHPRPTHRPSRARRRLRLPWLCPSPGLVRSPPSVETNPLSDVPGTCMGPEPPSHHAGQMHGARRPGTTPTRRLDGPERPWPATGGTGRPGCGG